MNFNNAYIVLANSGGLDSTTILYYIVKRLNPKKVFSIVYDYNQKLDKEIKMAEKQVNILKNDGYNNVKHETIDIKFMNKLLGKRSTSLVKDSLKIPTIREVVGQPQPITYVPNRNMILLSIATAYLESRMNENNVSEGYVFYGAQLNDQYTGYWDAQRYFVEKMNEVLKLNRTKKIRIIAPFANYSKDYIVYTGMQLKVDYSQTWTCYNGMAKACGKCSSCADRIMAFVSCGISDPLSDGYEINIDWNSLIRKYKKRLPNNILELIDKEVNRWLV